VKVYLLLMKERPSLFYSNESEVEELAEAVDVATHGFRGRLLTRWRRFQETFHQADSGALGWCRRAWEWLHSRTPPDEPMLFRFRATARIDLHYPQSHDPSAVTAIWCTYLSGRRRSHAARLVANLIIAPIAGILLFPLPGPNLIGYWFAYRAIHHVLVLGGIRRAIRGRIPISYHPESWLDLPVDGDPWGHSRPAA
jgi:hypothetical protein